MTFRNPDFVSQAPYHDDFDDTKNFLKMLFKPGYAIQARELTQLQTILQSQIAKFADHIFTDGSKIFGGEIQLSNLPYIRVTSKQWTISGGVVTSTATNANTLLQYWQTEQINILKVFDSNLVEKATIRINYYEPANYSINDPYAVIFHTVNSISPEVTSGEFTMEPGLLIGESDQGPFLRIPSLNTSTIEYIERKTEGTQQFYTVSPFGEGALITVNGGIFYVDGYFVTTEKQTISLFKVSSDTETEETIVNGSTFNWARSSIRLFSKPSQRIGYTINREIVTAADDTTLNDPANGFYNYTAPGADRYKINLKLSSVLFESNVAELDNFVTEDFIQLMRMTYGIVDYTKNNTTYAQILDLFARRTHDESGSYTVKPFLVEAKDHLRKDRYILQCTQALADSDIAFHTLPIGGYIWPSNFTTFNPFDPSVNYDTLSFPVGQVVDFIKDYKDSQRIFKLVCEIKNKYPLTAQTSAWRYQYKGGPGVAFNSSAGASGNGALIQTNAVVVELSSNGMYSLKDTPKGDSSKLAITVKPGKGYVRGYEYETFAPRTIDYNVFAANDIITLENQNIDFPLGNYAKVYFPEAEEGITSVFPTQSVKFEKLPIIELIGNVVEFRLFPSGLTSNNRGIYAWAPFKYTDENVHGDMVDIQMLKDEESLENVSYPHESVLFVYYDGEDE